MEKRTREQSPFEKRPVEGPVDPRSASVVDGPDRNTGDIRSGSPVQGDAGVSADIPEQSEGYERERTRNEVRAKF